MRKVRKKERAKIWMGGQDEKKVGVENIERHPKLVTSANAVYERICGHAKCPGPLVNADKLGKRRLDENSTLFPPPTYPVRRSLPLLPIR